MAIDKNKEAMKLALEAAYLAGWNASGEGYNAEYPFGDHARNPEEDAVWVKDRDNALQEALAEQPAQPYKGIADHTNQVTNGRMRTDSVTGDVGIGTPFSQPAQGEKK